MRVFLLILSILSILNSHAQTNKKSLGHVGIHMGTSIFYNTASIRYESPAMLTIGQHHSFGLHADLGIWQSSVSQKNTGLLNALGFTYLIGNERHCFEHSSSLVAHFDKGLKGQPVVYIASLYRGYVGYRFRFPSKRLYGKIGIGWREFIQLGFQYSL